MSLGPIYTSTLRVREYNPDGTTQSKHIPLEEWEKHGPRIRALHSKTVYGRRYNREKVLAELSADCGCRTHCSFSPSPSQYSAQLRTWGLRTYRSKGATPRNSRRGQYSISPQRRMETAMSSPAREAYPEQGVLRLGVQSPPQDRSLSPGPTCVLFRPSLESVEEDRVSDDPPGVGFQGGHFGHRPSNETLPLGQEVDNPVNLEPPLPPSQASESPQSSANVYPHFAASETVQDAVRRVVQTLSEVLEDHALKEYFDNLADAELNELLTNHVKLERTCHDASLQHAKRIRRVWGESFALVEICNSLERRTRSFYCWTPQATSVSHSEFAEAQTSSSIEYSPTSHNSNSVDGAADVHIYDQDTEMLQNLAVLDVSGEMEQPKASVNMSKQEPLSCTACLATPRVEYEVSIVASRLCSEVSSRQDRFKAYDEIRMLAGCLFAARSYADAFDLYYIIWTEFGPSLVELERLAAAIDCARASATPRQDSCVEAILHHVLNAYPKDPFLSRSPEDLLQESILHSFLRDLYENLNSKTNAEAHGNKALFHLDEQKLHILQRSFGDQPHIIYALESQIANRQRSISQAIGYNALTIPNHDVSKNFAAELQKSGLIEDLLPWCVKTIHENAHGLDAFRSILPKQPLEQRGFIWRTLLCYLIERWLSERQKSSHAEDSITFKVLAAFAGFLSPPEALSAIAMLIVDDCPDQHKPLLPAGRQPPVGILSSALLRNIKDLTKLRSTCRSFSEVYSSLMAASRDVRGQQLDDKSQAMLLQFMMNIAPSSLVNRYLPPRRVGLHGSLVPSPELFREFEIRRASLSNRLYSPRSSFSSGLNSIRATATSAMANSILSFAKRQSQNSASAISATTDRSSWSFGGVTGMPRPSSVYSRGDMVDHDAGATRHEYQDEEMVDA